MPSEASKGSIYPGLCPEGELRRGFLVGLEVNRLSLLYFPIMM